MNTVFSTFSIYNHSLVYDFIVSLCSPQDCPEASLDSVIKICETLTAANRGEVVRKLAELEFVQNDGGIGGG